MSLHDNKLSFYVFKDLAAAQNKTFSEGNEIVRTDTLAEAIGEFRKLPKEWLSAIGVSLSDHSELDLVQRLEGEPVLVGDYQMIPHYDNDPAVRSAVRALVRELDIEWQAQRHILSRNPAICFLCPVVPEMDLIRDRCFSGKHLYPDKPQHIFTAIQELCTPEKGWQPLTEVWDAAVRASEGNGPIPKVTSLHVCYADQNGHTAQGDMAPYDYILMKERTQLMARDIQATKSLAAAVEDFIRRLDLNRRQEELGPANVADILDHDVFFRVKELNVQHTVDLIDKRDLAPLIEPIVEAIEEGRLSDSERPMARELLGRLMNVPEDRGNKISLDLRMRATASQSSLYHSGTTHEKNVRPERTPTQQEGR